MIEVDVPKDIREYEPKLFNLVTLRQVILLIIGCAIAVLAFFVLPIKDWTVRGILSSFLFIPSIIFGWMEVYGMKLEKFLWQVIKSSLLVPKVRPYKPESTIDYLPEPIRNNPKKKKKITRTKQYVGRR